MVYRNSPWCFAQHGDMMYLICNFDSFEVILAKDTMEVKPADSTQAQESELAIQLAALW